MASFNRVVLLGNLTRDIELRYIGNGTAVTDIGLAVNDRVKRNDQWVDETTFVDITFWGRTAEVANEYLSKGSSVLIEGRLENGILGKGWPKTNETQSRWRTDADGRRKGWWPARRAVPLAHRVTIRTNIHPLQWMCPMTRSHSKVNLA